MIRSCIGPSGSKTHYFKLFTKENLRALVKERAGDNIAFVLKDETTSDSPRSVNDCESIETRIDFFVQDYDYLFNPEYIPKEVKAVNRRMSELILSGKAKDEQEAAEMVDLEQENKKAPSRKDSKSGVPSLIY